jgi:endonuclease-8
VPEGDSLFIIARELHAALAGQVITRFASPRPELKERDVEGRRVVKARAHGKHAIIELDDGRAILSHLRMQGHWRVRPKRDMPARQLERLQREPRWDDESLSLILETETAIAVLEDAAVVELAPLPEIEARLSGLGPDILSSEFDATEAVRRLRAHSDVTIAEALMLQSAVAGIGNVYKCETLFLEKLSPFVLVSTLDDATLTRLLGRARQLMRRNLGSGPRRTTFGSYASDAHWVYERSGKHCLKCDAKVGMRRQGPLQRSTYFCPECQGIEG